MPLCSMTACHATPQLCAILQPACLWHVRASHAGMSASCYSRKLLSCMHAWQYVCVMLQPVCSCYDWKLSFMHGSMCVMLQPKPSTHQAWAASSSTCSQSGTRGPSPPQWACQAGCRHQPLPAPMPASSCWCPTPVVRCAMSAAAWQPCWAVPPSCSWPTAWRTRCPASSRNPLRPCTTRWHRWAVAAKGGVLGVRL